MQLEPEIGVGPLRFGDGFDAVTAALGSPVVVNDVDACALTMWQYDSDEICILVFSKAHLVAVSLLPKPDTYLWSQAIHRMSRNAVMELASNNGYNSVFKPSPAKGIRPKLEVLSAGLIFYFEDDVLDSVDIHPSNWQPL